MTFLDTFFLENIFIPMSQLLMWAATTLTIVAALQWRFRGELGPALAAFLASGAAIFMRSHVSDVEHRIAQRVERSHGRYTDMRTAQREPARAREFRTRIDAFLVEEDRRARRHWPILGPILQAWDLFTE